MVTQELVLIPPLPAILFIVQSISAMLDPAPQYEYVQVLHRKHKALGFFNNSCIRANTHFHFFAFFFNVELSRIYVSGGGNLFPKHSSSSFL